MPRYELTIEYDARRSPLQIQANGPSVQGELARAIEALSGVHFVPRGAGRRTLACTRAGRWRIST